MPRQSRKLLKISEVAKSAGVLPSTIRYYTDIGILKAESETPGGHRLYDGDAALSTVKRVQFMSQQGRTMDEIKKELAVSVGTKKILVIDDEPEVGRLIEEVSGGYSGRLEVKVVYDGFSAGRILSEYLPDLIILDLMLPGVNGFEVCKQIRSSQYLNGVKILAVTGYDSPDNKKRILECGATDYLPKPMDVETIRRKISELTGIKTDKI